MTWQAYAKVQADHLTLAGAVPLLDGTEVVVQVEPVPSPPATPDGSDEDFAAFFGLWANREDVDDSAAWVQREREQWRQRPTRPA